MYLYVSILFINYLFVFYFLACCIISLPPPLLCLCGRFYFIAFYVESTTLPEKVLALPLYSLALHYFVPFFASVVLLVLVCRFQVPCLLVRWKILPAFDPDLFSRYAGKGHDVWVGLRCVGLTLRWWYGLFLEAWSSASWS